jgi:hypothetical protein
MKMWPDDADAGRFHRAKERNEAFQSEYAKVITRFTGEFIADFCGLDGAIIWEKVLKFNSSSDA